MRRKTPFRQSEYLHPKFHELFLLNLELWFKPESNSENLAVIYLHSEHLVWRRPAWYGDKIYLGNIFKTKSSQKTFHVVLRVFPHGWPIVTLHSSVTLHSRRALLNKKCLRLSFPRIISAPNAN